MTSCVQDDDYTVPSSLGDEENALLQNLLSGNATEVTIAQVKAMYLVESDPGDNAAVQIDTDIYVKGYVSSSDQTGNFFKEFYIQDSPTNPTAALKVALDQVDTYNQFNLGREVYINLNGLYVGEERIENGVVTIGGDSETDDFGTTIIRLNQNQLRQKVLRSTTTEVMMPLEVSLSQISNNHVGFLVNVQNVEFADNLIGQAYFDPIQSFDTQRTLQTCDGFSYTTFPLETSSFASFKNETLPLGNGSLEAVVSKTFDGSNLVLTLNSTDGVNLNGDRCALLDINDFTIAFEEDFESFNGFPAEGWTNVNISGTNTDWFISGFNSNDYARISAFNSNNADADVWLVTPAINLAASSNKILTFDLEIAYSTGIHLTAFISTDFTGDPTTATWENINAPIPYGPTSGFGGLQSIGSLDISSYSGNVYIGFFYEGSDPTQTTRYHVDNLKVLTN